MGGQGLQGEDGHALGRSDQQQRGHSPAGAGENKATTQQGLEIHGLLGVHPQWDQWLQVGWGDKTPARH